MSTIGYERSAAPMGADARSNSWRKFARALRRFDQAEGFSPVICVTMLLLVGLLVKLTPLIQACFRN